MRTKRIVFFTLMVLAISSFNSPVRTIKGVVTDAQDGSTLPGVSVVLKNTTKGSTTDINGEYEIDVPEVGGVLAFSFIGYTTKEVKVAANDVINVQLEVDVQELSEIVVTGYGSRVKRALSGRASGVEMEKSRKASSYDMAAPSPSYSRGYIQQEPNTQHNTEGYDAINENIFLEVVKNPLSTFSIDVDAASYSNMRRFLNNGQKPPKDAVRIEEMVNYFNYDYKQPVGEHPFAIHTEISTAPWNEQHKLVHIGLQGKEIATDELPPSNLVFLIDVSGSMSSSNKLPLLKSAFKLLTEELREEDKVSIVVYAGAAGMVLPPTSGTDKKAIFAAFDKLQAGGSTAGGAGIKLAYRTAMENFVERGNNRVIIATDGDFNVGESSNAAMERLIEEKREHGVFLTVLGFGMGNYKDSKMEILADKGNGNYAYIDNILEAKKVLVNEFGGTLFTIAKDVKLQIEFNPAKVKAYRLIGYENRKLQNEDFNNDKKDAGELGSGHSVTALYEIIPVGVESAFIPVDELKYQSTKIDKTAYRTAELMTVKFRYKQPDGAKSKLIVHPVTDQMTSLSKTSDNFRWSAAVASFGMLLRDSEFKGSTTIDNVLSLAQGAKGADAEGYRIEFINLVKSSRLMASN
ncbi:MAG: von Willebrand factor type A domain-containing protein [Cyclobacteriaceae bacterium]|nr:von Willebrand factor type A domain-containing protein [Cyclobacteriaceae bacterium]